MRQLLRVVSVVVMVLGLFAVRGADAISVNFNSLTNATVEFVGTGDTFRDGRLRWWGYGRHSGLRDHEYHRGGGFASLVGLLGNVTGTFAIGRITTVGPVQTADVSGAGIVSIHDGAASLTADLHWLDITLIAATGAVNSSDTVNLPNFVYAGSNVDLIALAGSPAGIVTASFQLIPRQSLTALTTNGATNSTSYSGSLSPVPEPTAMFLGGTGLVWLAYAARRHLFRR